jgi:hypothetical protein
VTRPFFIAITACLISLTSYSQTVEYVRQGEFGFSFGVAHYFGDLNTRAALNRPKPALGVFFRRQFGEYIGLRVGAHFAQLGYSDVYSKNEYQKARNLSFNTNIWELALQGDFNFFKFEPSNPDYIFTPYVTLGIGLFTYDPYAVFNGKKEYLRPLGTEGQNLGINGRSEYGTMSYCVPVGVGIKYNISPRANVSFEISHRFTGTDYLDDVSTTYVDRDLFPVGASGIPSAAYYLQDRSYETLGDANRLGSVPGRQRGWSKQKDQYVFGEIGISFNINTHRCPDVMAY